MLSMFQVVFMAIGLAALVFVVASLFKKYQRTILWAAALTLFIGTSMTIGTGMLIVFNKGVVNHAVMLGITLAYACSACFAYGAEKVHKAIQSKQSSPIVITPEQTLEKRTIEQPPQPEGEKVTLPEKLDTELARRIFSRALETGLMKENGNHYKWMSKKILLAYMCGRIYCEDTPKYSTREDFILIPS